MVYIGKAIEFIVLYFFKREGEKYLDRFFFKDRKKKKGEKKQKKKEDS